MAEQTVNPYVGPLAFEEKDRANFFGRDNELLRLRSLAVSRRAVLLYAPSGAGKSSLLKAGLLPELRESLDAVCFPVARVGGDPPEELEPSNLYVFHLLSYLLGESCAPEEIAALSLSAGLRRALGACAEPPEVAFLTLDQFEEIFSVDPHRHAEREDFFRQLQQALADHPELTLLLALREDWLAHLDPHLDRFPDRLRARFRLELLGRKAALEAITRPASNARVHVLPEAAELLVDDLLQSPVRPGTEVDPVQLQIVCHRLWTRRPAGAVEIDATQVRSSGGAGRALAEYWEERVEEAARQTKVPEREIRDWCERELITPQHVRGQVLADKRATKGLDNRVIEALVNAHLLRPEPRRGAVWYELAHDRLIEPVVRNNREWRERNATDLEKQALRWKAGEPKAKLLKGSALRKATRKLDPDASPAAQEFLLKSWEARSGKIRDWTFLVTLLLLIASVVFNVLLAWPLRSLICGDAP